MENLEFNIFSDDDSSDELFGGQGATDELDDASDENKDKNKTTEVNPETIFGGNENTEKEDEEEDDSLEGVGSEENKNKEDSTSTAKKSGSSPNTYSSIAAALKEDGVLPNLEDDDIKGITSPDDFAEAIEKEVTKRLDDSQRRMKEALDYGVAPSEVSNYERTLNYLDSLNEDTISDESEQGETLRKQLIFQDYVNRGFSQERARKEMEKSFSAGTDVDDAMEALESNKDFFKDGYNNLVKSAKKDADDQKKAAQKQAETLKKSILETESPYEGIKLPQARRQKIYDSLTKVVHKTEDGRGLNAIQKYELDNPTEFRQKLATLFELTNGFKDLDTIVAGKANKQTRKNLREIEHSLRNTPMYSDGTLKLANGSDDSDSYSGLKLDV